MCHSTLFAKVDTQILSGADHGKGDGLRRSPPPPSRSKKSGFLVGVAYISGPKPLRFYAFEKCATAHPRFFCRAGSSPGSCDAFRFK